MTPTRLLAAVIVVTAGLSFPMLSASAQASALVVTPSSGPPGTTVTLSGTVPASQRDAYLTAPHVLWFEMNVNAGTFQLSDEGTVSMDGAGNLVATFTVPASGEYLRSVPDALRHPAFAGRYHLTFPCHACDTGASFTITATAQSLPVTGKHAEALALLGATLLSVGALTLHMGHRRPAR